MPGPVRCFIHIGSFHPHTKQLKMTLISVLTKEMVLREVQQFLAKMTEPEVASLGFQRAHLSGKLPRWPVQHVFCCSDD